MTISNWLHSVGVQSITRHCMAEDCQLVDMHYDRRQLCDRRQSTHARSSGWAHVLAIVPAVCCRPSVQDSARSSHSSLHLRQPDLSLGQLRQALKTHLFVVVRLRRLGAIAFFQRRMWMSLLTYLTHVTCGLTAWCQDQLRPYCIMYSVPGIKSYVGDLMQERTMRDDQKCTIWKHGWR